ncbi:MAG: biotin--[acetyl-CoA-carboxylase] ligase [Bacteroidaceae bacterium]
MKDYSTPIGIRRHIHLTETVSTNLFIQENREKLALKDGTVVSTDYQVAGRGQRGNSWEATSGENLLFSILLEPSFLAAKEQFYISKLIAVSIQEVLSHYLQGVTIKWPNDIYWNQQKIAGILIEHELEGTQLTSSIIGVGLNVNQTAFHSGAPNPVSLRQIIGKKMARRTLLTRILQQVVTHYNELKRASYTLLDESYQSLLFAREEWRSFQDKNGVFEGKIVGTNPLGQLLIYDRSMRLHPYAFKEVSYIL